MNFLFILLNRSLLTNFCYYYYYYYYYDYYYYYHRYYSTVVPLLVSGHSQQRPTSHKAINLFRYYRQCITLTEVHLSNVVSFLANRVALLERDYCITLLVLLLLLPTGTYYYSSVMYLFCPRSTESARPLK